MFNEKIPVQQNLSFKLFLINKKIYYRKMAKSKGARIVITLECKTSLGVYRYTTTKNRRNTPNRLEIKKYCPLSKKHEIFKEIK